MKTLSSSELSNSLDLIEVKPGLKFSRGTLKSMLPDTESVLFFGKVYELDAEQLGNLLVQVLDSDVARALLAEGHAHSTDLQDYIVQLTDEYGMSLLSTPALEGQVTFDPTVSTGEILPEVWKSLEIEVAQSIKDVASKLENVIGLMPGKQGQMAFKSMMVMNRQRPVLGDYRAHIHHAPQKQNLVILDVSGSMSEGTIRRIVDDVVALSYQANAHMAVVSDSCTHWEPGTYTSNDVLTAAEFSGTHYERLKPLFDRDWGTVVTIADYDSSRSAKSALASSTGRIDQVLDMSLVNQPTYLAECVGQLATKVKPLLIANSYHVLND